MSRELLDAMYDRYVKRWQESKHNLHYSEEGQKPFSEDDWKEIEEKSGASIIRNEIK